jgi:hypothetical protein
MTRRLRTVVVAFVLVGVFGALGGCAAMRVHPWDRDLLADPAMSFDPDPMFGAIDQHVYFSKEASVGGQDAAGGGCGCN